MALSEKAKKRLAQLGYVGDAALSFWQGLWESEGESFFWDFLAKDEEAAKKYREWFPKLQRFAYECRVALPIPAVTRFSDIEREQHRVLAEKIQAFLRSEDRRCILEPKPNQAAIVSTTRVGLAAAAESFRGTGAVILKEDEREHWFTNVYPINHEAFWWYVFAWWTIREVLADEEMSIRPHHPIPEGSSYWVVVSGIQWGSLAGGATHELWQWNGKRAEFIDVYCVDTY